jgi:hypothetical protein
MPAGVLSSASRFALSGGLVLLVSLSAQAADDTFDKDIRPLLAERCLKCHGAVKPRGRINLATWTDERAAIRQRKVLGKVIAQLEAKEMPPAAAPQMTDEQRERLLRWAKSAVQKTPGADVAQRDPGPALVRRLNRTEYERTIADLVGIRINARELVGLPDDKTGEGFDNLAQGLTLSASQLDKYFLAADKILERLFGTPDGTPSTEPFNRQEAQRLAATIAFLEPGGLYSDRAAAREIITRFARRAFRRPVSDTEVARLMRLYDQARQRSDRHDNGLRLMLKAVLVSPHFLLRVERDRTGAKEPYPVNDHELAVRLSYFLWSTMPDAPLFALADQNKLSDPAVLDQQIKRMLADRKTAALSENFAVQWLQLRKVHDARPSPEFFPTFTVGTRVSMYNEVYMFFDKLREEDKSILDLLDADYTYVNDTLVEHYRLPVARANQWRKVQLRPEDHRGGLLGMGAILAMTSHNSRTSPTLRGKWVLDVIFGTPPPPPPPDAGVLKEEKKKGQTPRSFRELMAQHATQANCAGCHKKMDPLGYALDSFDAVGRWRDNENGQPLDTKGQLPTGEKFDGPAELKKIILARKDEFVRNLSEQMLIYALGRELQECDDRAIDEAVAELKKNDYRFSALVRAIVQSYPFQHRRND